MSRKTCGVEDSIHRGRAMLRCLNHCFWEGVLMAALMVVDDEPDILEFLCAVVRRAGHSVVKATSGVAALDVLAEPPHFDLLLTDVMMPGLNGFNLARIARMRRPTLKFLFLTGFHDLALTLRDPFSDFGKVLHKPILPADLNQAVAEALAPRP